MTTESSEDGGGCRTGGDWILNHNETTAEDEEVDTEALDDLPVIAAQATKVAGGARPWTFHKAVDNPDLI